MPTASLGRFSIPKIKNDREPRAPPGAAAIRIELKLNFRCENLSGQRCDVLNDQTVQTRPASLAKLQAERLPVFAKNISEQLALERTDIRQCRVCGSVDRSNGLACIRIFRKCNLSYA